MSMNGTILRGIGGFYYVLGEDGTVSTLHAQSKLRSKKLKPMVGDRVEFEPGQKEDDGWLKAILPRKNELVRPSVSNIDCLAITMAASVPEADLLLVDRILLSCRRKSIEALIVINKCDEDPDNARSLAGQYEKSGCGVYTVSAATGVGIRELRSALQGSIHAFAGQSGVGKSSLINALYGFSFEVGDISEKIERGKHTTRACSLVPANGGAVLDTPGFSLLESDLLRPEELQEYYREFETCRQECFFQTCLHDAEPGCEVKARVEAGEIPKERYARYLILLGEMRERWSKRYD